MAPATPQMAPRTVNTPAAQAPPATAPLKIHQPDLFDGDRKKLKSWLVQFELFFGFNEAQFPTDQSKILYATSYLRKGAFDWMEGYATDFLRNKDDPHEMAQGTREIFASYTEFVRRVKRTFGDIDEERTAERHLQGLTQKTSVGNYAAEFQQYAVRTEWNDEALVAQFYRGLKDRVKDDIARGERPATLAGMITAAIRIDGRQFERGLEKGGSYRAPIQNYKPKHMPYKPKPYYGPQPMELDATHHGGPRKGPLSPRDRDHRMKNNLCLYCGKPGHKARDCQSAARKNQGNRNFQRGKPRHLNATYAGPALVPDELEEPISPTPNPTRSSSDQAAHEHALLSWTGCYQDDCQVHLSDKDGSGWFPKKPRRQRNRRDVSPATTDDVGHVARNIAEDSRSPPSPDSHDGWTVVELEEAVVDDKGKQVATSLDTQDSAESIQNPEDPRESHKFDELRETFREIDNVMKNVARTQEEDKKFREHYPTVFPAHAVLSAEQQAEIVHEMELWEEAERESHQKTREWEKVHFPKFLDTDSENE